MMLLPPFSSNSYMKSKNFFVIKLNDFTGSFKKVGSLRQKSLHIISCLIEKIFIAILFSRTSVKNNRLMHVVRRKPIIKFRGTIQSQIV